MQTFKIFIPSIDLYIKSNIAGPEYSIINGQFNAPRVAFNDAPKTYANNSARICINTKPVTGWITTVNHLISEDYSMSCNNNI